MKYQCLKCEKLFEKEKITICSHTRIGMYPMCEKCFNKYEKEYIKEVQKE